MLSCSIFANSAFILRVSNASNIPLHHGMLSTALLSLNAYDDQCCMHTYLKLVNILLIPSIRYCDMYMYTDVLVRVLF